MLPDHLVLFFISGGYLRTVVPYNPPLPSCYTPRLLTTSPLSPSPTLIHSPLSLSPCPFPISFFSPHFCRPDACWRTMTGFTKLTSAAHAAPDPPHTDSRPALEEVTSCSIPSTHLLLPSPTFSTYSTLPSSLLRSHTHPFPHSFPPNSICLRKRSLFLTDIDPPFRSF